MRWQFGEGSTSSELNPAFEYHESGEYSVQLLAYYPEKTDTISRQISIHPAPVFELGNDTTTCPKLNIGVNDNFVSYLWNTGESSSTINVETEGQYTLSVENMHECISSDTINVSLYDLPDPLLPDTIDLAALMSRSGPGMEEKAGNGTWSFPPEGIWHFVIP